VRTDVPTVELADREMSHLVAEDFLENCVGGGFQVGGDADKALVRVAAAKASGQATGDLDSRFGGEAGSLPGPEPAVKGSIGLRGNREIVAHGDEG
jgi:hypothetical protein